MSAAVVLSDSIDSRVDETEPRLVAIVVLLTAGSAPEAASGLAVATAPSDNVKGVALSVGVT